MKINDFQIKKTKVVKKLRIEDLAEIMGKTKFEVEKMLKASDVIELNLSERKSRYRKPEDDDLRIFE